MFGLLIIAFISFINLFPKGYTFSGGDITQLINLKSNLGNMFYTWNAMGGTGSFFQTFSYSIYYLPFYLLSLLTIAPSSQSFFYFFIFLASSYVSFFIATKNFIKTDNKRSFEIRLLVSFIYAINPYTFYVFVHIWGYSPFLFLYALIPVMFSFTYSYFKGTSIINKNLALLGIIFFLSNIAFGNFSFFVSIVLFLGLFVVAMFILTEKNKKSLLRVIAYVVLFFSATFWTTIPILSGMMSQFTKMTSSGYVFNLGGWILSQRSSILPQFFLLPGVDLIKNFSLFFAIGAVGFILLLAISIRKLGKMSITFLILALLSIFITSKGKGLIPDNVALQIFTLPVLNTLRSYDKTLVFLPFFFIIVIYLGLSNLHFGQSLDRKGKAGLSFKVQHLFKSHLTKIIFVCLFLILIGIYPFFTGGMQTTYSTAFGSPQNYQTSNYSYLVQIPQEYYTASSLLSQDNRQDRLLDLPYSVINSIDWVNYPKWKVVGIDPTAQLFSKPSVQSNDAISPYWEEWNSADVNSTWIIKLMSLYNIQYLVYHKDVSDKFINQTLDKIDFLQNSGYITLMDNYENFELFNLSSTYFLPHIYPSSNVTLVQGSSDQLLSSIISNNDTDSNAFFLSSQTNSEQWQTLLSYNDTGKDSEAAPQIIFQEINPTHYQVKIENVSQPFFLVFSESYAPEWKAYVQNSETRFGETIANYPNVGVQEAKSTTNFTPGDAGYLFEKSLPDGDHYMVNGYANAWYIDPAEITKDQNGTFEVTLFYQPQGMYYVGIGISGATFVACIISVMAQTGLFKSMYYLLRKRKVFN